MVFEIIRGGKKYFKIISKLKSKPTEALLFKMIKFNFPGLYILELSRHLREFEEIPNDITKGIFVSLTMNNTFSKMLGLNEGDIISTINGKEINTINDFYKSINNLMSLYEQGKFKKIIMAIWRKNLELEQEKGGIL